MDVAQTGGAGTLGHVRLLEALFAVAVVAVAGGAWLSASGAFARFSTHQASPVRAAAQVLAEQTLRVAQDTWKYGSPGSAPSGSWSTALAVNAANAAPTSVPAGVRTSIAASGQSANLTVTVTYTPDPQHPDDTGSVTLSGVLDVKAPAPGSTLVAPALVPQPSGAP